MFLRLVGTPWNSTTAVILKDTPHSPKLGRSLPPSRVQCMQCIGVMPTASARTSPLRMKMGNRGWNLPTKWNPSFCKECSSEFNRPYLGKRICEAKLSWPVAAHLRVLLESSSSIRSHQDKARTWRWCRNQPATCWVFPWRQCVWVAFS